MKGFEGLLCEAELGSLAGPPLIEGRLLGITTDVKGHRSKMALKQSTLAASQLLPIGDPVRPSDARARKKAD